jgi:hypothetical protein
MTRHRRRAQAHPEVFARKSVGQIADHFEAVIHKLAASRRPGIAVQGEDHPAHQDGLYPSDQTWSALFITRARAASPQST